MKKGITFLAILYFCLLIFVSCGDNKSEQTKNALRAFNDVLQNNIEFMNTDGHGSDTQRLRLKELLSDSEQYKIIKFTLLDMDRDNTPELIFQYCTIDNKGDVPDFLEILKHHDGKVYGLNRTYREMKDLKIDASFSWSYSGFDNGYSKLGFESNSIKIVNLGYCQSSNDNQAEYFFVNDKAVSEDEYTYFCENQNKKEYMIWYDYTSQNIKKYL